MFRPPLADALKQPANQPPKARRGAQRRIARQLRKQAVRQKQLPPVKLSVIQSYILRKKTNSV
jgi:hypothetical protein